MGATIFLSCGQSHLWPDEKKTAKLIETGLRALGFSVFLAVAKDTIQNLNSELLEYLKNADYYLFINFQRESITNGNIRGSLYTNQELGMAYALGFDPSNMLLLSHEKVETAGLLGSMISNIDKFKNYDDVVQLAIASVERNHWTPDYSRKLSATQVAINKNVDDWRDRYNNRQLRHERIAWVEVSNRRPDIVAFNCVAHLTSIGNKLNSKLPLEDTFPIKCWGVDGYHHTIWPNSSGRFDLFGIEAETNHVFMHTQCDITDDSGCRTPIIKGTGQFILNYEIYADHFPITSFAIKLDLKNTQRTLTKSVKECSIVLCGRPDF